LYNPSSGGCYDGLHFDRVNLNQGAESTLAFLLALEEMKRLQISIAAFTPVSGLPRLIQHQPAAAEAPVTGRQHGQP
jgi:hypothetical protein